MSEKVSIMLMGGPFDGETLEVPAQEVGRVWRFATPYRPTIAEMYVPDGTIPVLPRHLEYRLKTVDFNGWPVPSITDDGAMRYQYAGEV